MLEMETLIQFPHYLSKYTTPKDHSSQLRIYALRKEQQNAEILWVLKFVMPHFSYIFGSDITDVFKEVFPNSAIAQSMKYSQQKWLISFGIVLYLINIHGRVERSAMICDLWWVI